ncbi:MAG: M20/M25/M40 family metallo-hydrolase [Bacteroidota bacterium]|nr:M20/M25/M40 family metallo-hydrolase [Bacteroidota bacterium]
MNILKDLLKIPSVTGEEYRMRDFLVDYFEKNDFFKGKAELFYGDKYQDNLIVKVGKSPKVAVYAHQDIIGYTVRYNNEIVPIGSPHIAEGTTLTGADHLGEIKTILKKGKEDKIFCEFDRTLEPGTVLVHQSLFRQTDDIIESPYLDNRVGLYIALKLAEQGDDFVIAFTTYEEQNSGGAQFCAKYIYDEFSINQALILDTAWVSEYVKHGNGPVISLRDRGIPRKRYIDKIRSIANKSGLNRQIEVERFGGSDGTAIQTTAVPVDWCFVGPPIKDAHKPIEKIKVSDIQDSIELYKALIKNI